MTGYLSHPTKFIKAKIELPFSKSESNRILMLQAISGGRVSARSLSESADTEAMQQGLNAPSTNIDIGDAGTAMRFLTAYYCATGQHKILTGSERMCHRPIRILVDALNDLGFSIKYIREPGYPPIEIFPADRSALKNEVSIAGDVSSQYISALLMIAPVLKGGLKICFLTEPVSRPYIFLTLELLRKAGIHYTIKSDEIIIDEQTFEEVSLSPDRDWSSASYWYSIAALAHEAEIVLNGLSLKSNQGDAIIAKWMEELGVKTTELDEKVLLTKSKPSADFCRINFSDHPDLAQTIIVLCAALGIPGEFSGLDSLRIKETDRIFALQNELAKMGASLREKPQSLFTLSGQITAFDGIIKTYGDHRMAMAFAPVALNFPLKIEAPEVVEKSFPEFWSELTKAGFLLSVQ